MPPDHPLVIACQQAATVILGTAPPLGQFHGGTDPLRFQAIGGIPTLAAFGPGQLPLAHGPNEWGKMASITQATRMYALITLDFGAVAS